MILSPKNNLFITAFVAVMMFSGVSISAQTSDSLAVNNKDTAYHPTRAGIVAIGLMGTYAVTMTMLNSTWYKDYPRSDFHYFNDNDEWLQMDKIGHSGSAYYLSRWSSSLINWTGTNQRKSAFIGAGISFGFLFSIEMLDGYSSEWGFSPGDIIANTSGIAIFLGQELAWRDQRITYKFSYHETEFAQYRPQSLGSNFSERGLKDYNGQTYWLSANIHSFLSKDSKFPYWLNIAFGYGADGMIGAESNDVLLENGEVPPHYDRIRQFYLAPDIDLTKIRTRSGFLKSVFNVFGFLKIPAPTLEYRNDGKFVFHGLYF